MLNSIIKLFDVNVDISNRKLNSGRLVLNSCKAIIYDKVYSEFDELNFAVINLNDYEFGYIEYEFGFAENFDDPYLNFYILCFAIRCNMLDYPIKINSPIPSTTPKYRLLKNYTKVNKDGNMSFGVRYFFRSLEERNALINGDEVLI